MAQSIYFSDVSEKTLEQWLEDSNIRLVDEPIVTFSDREKEEFYSMVFSLMEENMARLSEDVSWLVEKFDYRNKDADWKNSKDAIQRGMQKLKGGYPADPPYKMNK